MSFNLRSQPLLVHYLSLFAATVLLDRLLKHWILKYVTGTVEVNRFFNLVIQWNRGVSFSFLHSDGTLGFIVLSAAILVVVVLFGFYAWGQYRRGCPLVGEMLVLGGAVSNLVDRVMYGAVLDFIDIHWGSWHFAVFNGADACVFIGIMIVFAATFFGGNATYNPRQ